jgi:uncharacterized protein YcbX
VSDMAAVRVQSLRLHPVKSCAGIEVKEALVVETGFDLDRAWMVVDSGGVFVTQRDLPRLALVRPTLRSEDLVLRAPGMLALHLSLDTVEAKTEATVWNDRVAAYDMGDLCARWFSDFLTREVRLVRFDPEQRRLASSQWTGDVQAETAFQDAFPLLVASTASLAEVNRRLAQSGASEVEMTRFRPNIVLEGLDAHGEDAIGEIVLEANDGPVVLRLVKPCARCTIPDVDPATATQGHAVGDVLAGYRADPRVGGQVTFGMNAIVVEGIDRTLRVGAAGQATVRFD